MEPKIMRFLPVISLLIFFGVVCRSNGSYASVSDTSRCVRQDELILFRMVNDMRTMAKMPALKLSPSLCLVARTHLADLQSWSPIQDGCGLQSWSNKGKWTPCCYNKDTQSVACMNNKPREMTPYKGDGYEVIFWDESGASPASAVKTWNDYPASKDIILNSGAWSQKKWLVMGVAMDGGYAILWLGETDDPGNHIRVCESDSLIGLSPVRKSASSVTEPVNNSANGKEGPWSYVVISNLTNLQSAKQEVSKLRKQGFNQAGFLKGSAGYRIYIGKYNDEEKANEVKRKYASKFKGIWILKE